MTSSTAQFGSTRFALRQEAERPRSRRDRSRHSSVEEPKTR